MQQLLKCDRCGELGLVDLDLPADLCRRCVKALRRRLPSRLDLMEALTRAVDIRETSGLSWDEAMEEEAREGLMTRRDRR